MIRLSLIISLLAMAAFIAFTHHVWILVSALPIGFGFSIIAWKSVIKALRALLPITIFVLALVLVQWLYHEPDLEVAAKTMAVFWLTASAFRLIPWSQFGNALRPGSRLSAPLLYLLFIRHFALILIGESRRLLTARSRTVFKPYGRWSFRSTVSALAALFLRSMNRAERFYAAQMLKGF